MRKKILTAFFFIAAGLMLFTLKGDLSATYYANRSQEPQYVFSQEVQISDEENQEQVRKNVLQWAKDYDTSGTSN